MKSILMLGMLLAGCAGAPQVITQTKTVEVPVAVPCKVKAVARPAWALDQVDPAADVFTKGRAALVEVGQRAAYEIRLEAAVAACK
ncbi:hypothetical protein [Cupriavidus basilensis]|uniref:hypothetical protein n=1 Tax=Cupriavidus basilensis TaxID=68895 RepID=UPI00157AEEEC|nr:hypothetical protein [Cupriavidus basilensis]NUA26089.1 hypothetical protein [Cupriavidus basilensis]